MRIYDIILKKRDGGQLSADEIEFLVGGYARCEVPDSQMAAWLMAVGLRGISVRETADLTMAIVHSGKVLDLSCIPGIKVDKHSTGGVGDKTTLVLMPLLAAAGLPMVKMAGCSLGYTGGTIDKLESIPGFSTALTSERMVEQVKRIGAAISGQTPDLAPADKKIYALRDLTATVDSIPLIASSVMSKKIAAGADAFVLDVKAGSGAFMKTVEDARKLARTMVEIGNQVGKKIVAVITDMNQPLGRAVGNALEVREAIETLRGNGPDDLVELCTVLGSISLVLGEKATTREEAEGIIYRLFSDGSGLWKLKEIIEAQGGNPAVVDDPSLLPIAPIIMEVRSPENGFVTRLDALGIAKAAAELGAGRCEPGVIPDLSVGVYLHKKEGDYASNGEVIAEVHAKDDASAQLAADIVLGAYAFLHESPTSRPLVYEII